MTPKEKALELFTTYTTKECAILVVNEIIKACDDVYDSDTIHFKETGSGEWWLNVITEIEKIMTPEEDAKQLIQQFKTQLDTATPNLNRPSYQAKKCALITVNKIIELNDFSVEGREYWGKVKVIIENLYI